MFGFDGFGIQFVIFRILWIIMFLIFICVFVTILAKNLSRNRKNDQSPRLTAETTVVTKRTHVWGDHSHTDYYTTFQFESGDRLELEIPREEFGYLVEGDRGKLTFQGTRYLAFERT